MFWILPDMKKILGIVCALALLSGCVTKNLSTEDRQQIKTLKVLPVFVAVDNFQYTSMTQAWGAGLGAGAGAATGMVAGASSAGTAALTGAGSVAGTKTGDVLTGDISRAIQNNMKANGIDLSQLIRQSFVKRAANASLSFTLTSAFIDLRDDNGGFNNLPSTADRPEEAIRRMAGPAANGRLV